MRDHGTVIAFIAGAIGDPGERTFLLQFQVDSGIQTFLLEKGQVAALGEQSIDLLGQIGFAGAGTAEAVPELAVPQEFVFRVGEIQLGYAEATGLITMVLGSIDDPDERVVFAMTPAMLDAAVREGLEVVQAGRPKCPRCGLAMAPDGHHCPKDNGDLREHRP